MSAVQPNSTILMLHNVPLDTTYANTIWFPNKEAQIVHFRNYTKQAFYRNTYQRVNKNTLRIKCLADDIYDCNYMVFANANHGERKFYAFVKRIDYINENCTEVEYELDVMQTWFFDFSLEDSFVEREHTSTDTIGEHIIDEKLDTGEYLVQTRSRSSNFNNLVPLVACTVDTEGTKIKEDSSETLGGSVSRAIVGMNIYRFTQVGLSNFFKNVSSKGTEDGIVSAYLAPSGFVSGGNGEKITSVNTAQTFSFSKNYTTLNGYKPKNKKLYTYPYNFLRVISSSGQSNVYRYEYFSTSDVEFHEYCTVTPSPTGATVPYSYKYDAQENWAESVAITEFPQAGYNIDGYKAWVAQTSSQRGNTINMGWLSTAIAALTGAAGGFLAGNIPGAVAGGVLGAIGGSVAQINSVSGILSEAADREKIPTSASQVDASLANLADINGFRYERCTIDTDYAKVIDDYFTMYGYAVHRVKTPNIHVRAHWTYCKTIGCNIRGSIPADDANKICSIFDAGITHWTNGYEVGNYQLDNYCLG